VYKYWLILVFSVVFWASQAQSQDFLLHHPSYYLIEKQQTQTQAQPFFSAVKPYSDRSMKALVDSIDRDKIHRFNQNYLKTELRTLFNSKVGKRSEGGIMLFGKRRLKSLYRYQNDFFSYQNEGLQLHINPVLQSEIGADRSLDPLLFTNSRGLQISGTIDGKVSFFTHATENQVQYPAYVKAVADSIGVIPYEGFWKEYDETKADFFRAFGYVDINATQHISAQVGFGRHFIGHGQRSMILSDFSNSYPYLRLETEIWKFKYTNLFASLMADVFTYEGGNLGNSRYPRKFMSLHYLELSLSNNLHLGLFETVISGRPDSLGGSSLKLEYLNPVIFYRAIEQQDGSADNALLGMELKWNPNRNSMLYGQFVLDEMIVSELTAGNGWWGNKYGYQVGVRYYDFLFDHLDLNLEHNWARPFTYSHDNFFSSYTHYLQPLAHPLGANFSEWLVAARYQPHPRLTLQFRGLNARYGVDRGDGINVGKDPQISYNRRAREYDYQVGEGINGNLSLYHLQACYQLMHNLFINGSATFRKETFENRIAARTSSIFVVGIRLNMPERTYLF
jgi:hypothetical protein